MKKRLAAIFLTMAMLLSLVVVPAAAEGSLEVVSAPVSCDEELNFGSTPLTSAAAGEMIAIRTSIINNTGSTFNLTNFQLVQTFNTDYLEPYDYYGQSAIFGPEFSPAKPPKFDQTLASSSVAEAVMTSTAAAAHSYPIKNGDTYSVYFMFTVKNDVESTDILFTYPDSITQNYLKYAPDTKHPDVDEFATNVVYKNSPLHINGVAPVLNSMSLDKKAVTVNGKDAVTVQGSARSAFGTDMTEMVEWSIDPADKDVTINAKTGKITVPAKAAVQTYTVYAKAGDVTKTETLSVSREASKLDRIELTGDQSLEIPALADTTEHKTNYSVQGYDQFGAKFAAGTIDWSGTNVGETGADFANGTLTLTKDTKPGTVQVVAKSGAVTSNTLNVTVGYADAELTKIIVSGKSSVDVPTVEAGKTEASASVEYTVSGKDQYDNDMTVSNVKWAIKDAETGASIEGGMLKLSNKTKAGTVKITATSGTVSSEALKVTINKNSTRNATQMVISGDATVTIPSSGSNTFDYTGVVYDQYYDKLSDATVTWDDSFGSFSAGTLTVPSETENGATGTMTFADPSKKLTAKTMKVTANSVVIETEPTIIAADGSYGDTWSDLVGVEQNGVAKLDGETITGTWYVKDADKVPDAGTATYEIRFMSGAYDVFVADGPVEIAKAPLSITANNQSVVYGNAAAPFSVTYDGFVAGENETTADHTGKLSFVCHYENPSDVGTYPIAPVGVTFKNYFTSFNSGTLTVTKAPLTITADDQTMTYGQAEPTYTATYKGFITDQDKDKAEHTGEPVFALNSKDVGSQTITVSGVEYKNYNVEFVNGTLTVNKAPVTFTWGSENSFYYNAKPQYPTVTLNGVLAADKANVKPVVSAHTEVGTGYTATVTGLTGSKAANYELKTGSASGVYEIKESLTSLSVKPEAITADRDGVTIKLSGSIDHKEDIIVTANGKDYVLPANQVRNGMDIVLNGVTYTVDTSNVHQRFPGSSDPDKYRNNFKITVTIKGNGEVSPYGTVSVRKGQDQTFTITPDKGYEIEKVLVDGENIGAVTKYTFKNVTEAHSIVVYFKSTDNNPFYDVASNDWFYNPVLWAVENGITAGLDEHHFGPGASCTRAQAVTFLWNAAGKPAPKTTASSFKDVKTSDWFYAPVMWAVENGITSGVSADEFGANLTVTRGQMMTFLWKANSKPEASSSNPFTDVTSGDWFYAPVMWAVENNITAGVSANEFAPDAPCTRGQIVTFLYKDAQ